MLSASTVVPTEVGIQKSSKLSAKGYSWIPDSSRMTTEKQLTGISDEL